MSDPLLSTKFYIPPLRSEVVPRQRLVDKLNAGLHGKLTLISAPAGFGKTTLLSACSQDCTKPFAWVSLDQGDDDPTRFLQYFVAAIQRINPEFGDEALLSLQSTQNPDYQHLLTNLLNEIMQFEDTFAIVLDDYHLISATVIQDLLIFCMENMPPNMHLVISSRSDPPWPLARFRVRNEVTEIRSHDLRFTNGEATSFLNEVMGLSLTSEDIAALDSKTEGWIAGLQMAALSMRGRTDISGFIQSFTGSHRYVIDYLMEEVLERQPSEIQDFLLKTSILERLNYDLCDAVMGTQSAAGGNMSQAMLEFLEQNNLFLIPLDDQRRWYRYHHLFADLLRNHLQQTLPHIVIHLHQRASVWYGMNDLLPDAIRHAIAVDDIEQVVYLTEALALDEMNLRETRALMAWLERLSDADFKQYPWLLVARSSVLFKAGKYDQVEQDFAIVEDILATRSTDDEISTRIRGHIAASRSYLAELHEDAYTAIRQAEAALALLPEKEIKLRSFVSIRRANGLMWIGEIEKAISAYKEIGEASKQIGDGQSAIIALSEMAIVQMIAGRLRQATESIQEICNYTEELSLRDGRKLPAIGILYRHLSNIHREQNNLAEASFYARESLEICQQWGEKEALIFGLLGVARVKFAQGKYAEVKEFFKQILLIAAQISPIAVEQFKSLEIHYQLLTGKFDEAEIWAQALELQPSDVFGYEHRFDYQNLAHLMVNKGKYNQALKVLAALVQVAEKAGDGYYLIQYWMLKAIILNKMSRQDEAVIAIGKALSMAGPEGYVRAILDEGAEVEGLLHKAVVQGIEVDYAQKLLTFIKDAVPQRALETDLIERLSPREMEVLRLLVTNLNTSEIANELVVSVSTVRSHIKSIYSKLAVHSRHEAVTRAKELGLV